jgi:hypothetical protein
VTTRTQLRLALGYATATLATGIVLGVNAFRAADVVAVYVVVLGAQTLAALTRSPAGSSEDSLFESALRRPREEALRPPELVRIERELILGMESAGYLHTRLRPILREAAAARLAAKHHVDLERRPETARALLGDDAWELLRPDRPEPADRNAPGLAQAKLRAVIDVLERL